MFKQHILSDKGNLAIAVVLSLFVALSGLTMAITAFHDSNNARLTFDGLQELNLLRSEIGRGRDAISMFD